MTQLPFMTRGIITALVGLGGTFLVLVLIFAAVKILQKLGDKK